MGVPGFFRWIYHKHKESQLITKKIESIESLFFDLNGLIHPQCQKVLETYFHFENIYKLEEKMIEGCIQYLHNIIKQIKPKQLVYIAIDGVAPMAKIKQQRYRRYKSVSDLFMYNNIKKKYGMKVNKHWNNSSITPGTIFMDKLQKALYEFCSHLKKTTNLTIILSDSNCVGEGEHKIFKFIKKNKFANYMIYGLDADLIFLSIASNRDNILLLREANQFNKNEKGFNIIKMDTFKELIVDIFEKEYKNQNKNNDMIKMDHQRLLYDFVILYFLLGNDFIPHIPSLHIYHNGSDTIVSHYIQTFFIKKEYILNETQDKINSDVLFTFFKLLSIEEQDYLHTIHMNDKKKYIPKSISDPYKKEIYRIQNLMFYYHDPIKLGVKGYEKRYYKHYNVQKVDKMVHHYLEMISWIHQYYFQSSTSWRTFYPYHAAPFVKDIITYFVPAYLNRSFKEDTPLCPFEQLSCVLHPYSFYLLPKTIKMAYLDIKHKSQPTRFNLDYLYKTKHFKAIPIIPNPDVEFASKIVKTCHPKLSEQEKNRNRIRKESFIF